jgi:nucleoid-associated protein YgaU
MTGRSRFHAVAKGESLTAISARYYGDASRWPEIYHANRDLLRGQTAIRIGQHLRVP